MILKAVMATIIGTNGLSLAFAINVVARKADATVANTAPNTHCHLIFKIKINE
jgi:hypothetical protein